MVMEWCRDVRVGLDRKILLLQREKGTIIVTLPGISKLLWHGPRLSLASYADADRNRCGSSINIERPSKMPIFYNVSTFQELLIWLETSIHNLLSALAERGRKKKNHIHY